MSRLQIAVVGAGHLGTIHARLMQQHPDAQLLAVVDPHPDARSRATAAGFPAVADLRQLSQPPDGVVIAAPSSCHYDIAAPLITQRIALLIEKPVTVQLRDALLLSRLANRFSTIVAVGQVERFNPAWNLAVQRLGKIRYLEAHRLSGYSYRSTDIGVVHDLMIHDLDLLASVIDSQTRQIDAWGTTIISPDEDVASARLQFECGAVAQLTASRCSPIAQRQLRVWGEHGFATIDMGSQEVDWVDVRKIDAHGLLDGESMTPSERIQARDQLFETQLPRQQLTVAANNAILDEQRDWLDAIHQRRAPRVDLPSACRSLSWVERICSAIRHQPVPQPSPSHLGLRRAA